MNSSPEVHCYVCSHVFEDIRPVLLVAREDGDWMFLCGSPHAENEEYHLVGVGHLFDRDRSLEQLRDLPENHEAERADVGGQWVITPSVSL